MATLRITTTTTQKTKELIKKHLQDNSRIENRRVFNSSSNTWEYKDVVIYEFNPGNYDKFINTEDDPIQNAIAIFTIFFTKAIEEALNEVLPEYIVKAFEDTYNING